MSSFELNITINKKLTYKAKNMNYLVKNTQTRAVNCRPMSIKLLHNSIMIPLFF